MSHRDIMRQVLCWFLNTPPSHLVHLRGQKSNILDFAICSMHFFKIVAVEKLLQSFIQSRQAGKLVVLNLMADITPVSPSSI